MKTRSDVVIGSYQFPGRHMPLQRGGGGGGHFGVLTGGFQWGRGVYG